MVKTRRVGHILLNSRAALSATVEPKKPTYISIPRGLYFNHEGLCVGTSYTRKATDPPFKRIDVRLPFDTSTVEIVGSAVIPGEDLIEVKGKTLAQINAEVRKFVRCGLPMY